MRRLATTLKVTSTLFTEAYSGCGNFTITLNLNLYLDGEKTGYKRYSGDFQYFGRSGGHSFQKSRVPS